MRAYKLSLVTLGVVLLAVGSVPSTSLVVSASVSAQLEIPAKADAEADAEADVEADVLFIENVGQFHPDARFLVRGGSTTLWLAEDALWVTIAEPPSGHIDKHAPQPCRAVNLRLSFPNSAPPSRIEPFGRLETKMHYYLGDDPARWRTDVPVWSGVRYVDLYPGVDLEIAGANGWWTWRLVCGTGCPDALRDVRLRVEGADDLIVDGGYLHLSTAVGDLVLPLVTVEEGASADRPVAAGVGGGAFDVTAPFSTVASDCVTSPSAAYPEEAYFGTYLGGGDSEWAGDIAVGGEGNIVDSGRQRAVYVVGWTTSSDFPTEPPGGTVLSGTSDVFVTKLRRVASLVRPEYSIYIGGDTQERGTGIVLDGNDNAYLTGWTSSNDFPVTPDAFDPTFNTCSDCDPCGNEMDAFVAKLDGTGALSYATYLGGSYFTFPGGSKYCGDDEGTALAVDRQGVVYVTGRAYSADFPTTAGAYDRELSNPSIGVNEDTFVVKLDPSLGGAGGLLYSTYVGGGTPSMGEDIAIDESGIAYVTGYARSDPWGFNFFPTTPGAYDGETDRGGGHDAFAFKLDPAGNGAADMVYSTLLGGKTEWDLGEGIAVDGSGSMYVVGTTSAPSFPTTPGAYDTTCGTDGNCNDRQDVFLSKLNPAGGGQADLLYSTFVGGNYWENFYGGSDIALGADGDIYITGDTSSDTEFPLTPDAYDLAPDIDWGDAFVVRLRPQGNGVDDLVYGTYFGGSSNDEGVSIALDEDGGVYVIGNTRSGDFPTTQRAFDKFLSGTRDAFVVRLLTPPSPDLSGSTKTVAPGEAVVGEVVTFTVQLVNSGTISTTVSFTDALPAELVLWGSPTSSSGDAPAVNGQTITWSGGVPDGAAVTIAYATVLTSTATVTPTAVNRAEIDDGNGNVYVRRAFVNGYHVFLPLVLREG